MRTRIDHEAPEPHQEMPPGNTSPHVSAQVARWLDGDGWYIHPQIAMEIASWWASPGYAGRGLAAFASHGDLGITSEDHDIQREIRAQLSCYREGTPEQWQLLALQAYVDEAIRINTQYRHHVWSCRGHRFMGTGTIDVESCIHCGGEYRLIPIPGDPHVGMYVGGSGVEATECVANYGTYRVHGIERHCDADDGRGCQASIAHGTCEHTDHDCDCLLCY